MTDKFDRLIRDAITEKLNGATVTEEEIELGWNRLQGQMKLKKDRSFTAYKKASVLLVGVITSAFIINSYLWSDSDAWQRFNIINIIKKSENISVNISSTLSEPQDLRQGIQQIQSNTIQTNMEEARELVSYRLKELPFPVDSVLVHLLGSVQVVEITYEEEKARFIQLPAGVESHQGFNFHPDTIVEEITIDGLKYVIAVFPGKKGKAIWTENNIHYTADFNYDITFEEIKEILTAMD